MKIKVDNLKEGCNPIYSCNSSTLIYRSGKMVKTRGSRTAIQMLKINEKSLFSFASIIKKIRDLKIKKSEVVIVIKKDKIGLLCTGIL